MPAIISISRRHSSPTRASRASPTSHRALCPAPPPTPAIVPLAGNIPIHAFRCRLDDIAPPRQPRTAAPTSAPSAANVWILDPVKEAPTGLRCRIKGVARAAPLPAPFRSRGKSLAGAVGRRVKWMGCPAALAPSNSRMARLAAEIEA